MLPEEADLVSEWTGLPGEAKSVKPFERYNGLDTALYKNYLYLYLYLLIASQLYDAVGGVSRYVVIVLNILNRGRGGSVVERTYGDRVALGSSPAAATSFRNLGNSVFPDLLASLGATHMSPHNTNRAYIPHRG